MPRHQDDCHRSPGRRPICLHAVRGSLSSRHQDRHFRREERPGQADQQQQEACHRLLQERLQDWAWAVDTGLSGGEAGVAWLRQRPPEDPSAASPAPAAAAAAPADCAAAGEFAARAPSRLRRMADIERTRSRLEKEFDREKGRLKVYGEPAGLKRRRIEESEDKDHRPPKYYPTNHDQRGSRSGYNGSRSCNFAWFGVLPLVLSMISGMEFWTFAWRHVACFPYPVLLFLVSSFFHY